MVLAIAGLNAHKLNSEFTDLIIKDVKTKGQSGTSVEEFIFQLLKVFLVKNRKDLSVGCYSTLMNIVTNEHNLFWKC